MCCLAAPGLIAERFPSGCELLWFALKRKVKQTRNESLPQLLGCPRRQSKQERRFARKSQDPQNLIPCFHAKSDRATDGFFQKCDLPEMIRVTPGCVASGREERNISGAKPMLNTFLIGHEAFTGDDKVGLVLVIVPFITCSTALPDYYVRDPVIGSHQ